MKINNIFKVLTLSILVSLISISSAHSFELPSPPKDYTWHKNEETKTALLIPDGWFFHEERKGETFGYFVSKEKIETSNYDTGLMLNVIPKVKQNLNVLPSQYMLTFLKGMVERATKVERQWEQNFGPFQGVGLEAIMGDAQNGWRQHALLIANDSTGTLYLVIFETPIALWDQNWPIIENTMRMLYMDTEY